MESGMNKVKEMSTMLMYEYVGVTVLTTVFNMGGVGAYAAALFFTSFICWQVSYANFNPAITIAQLIVETKDNVTGQFTRLLIIIIFQGLGAFTGTGLTYLMTIYFYNIGGTQAIATLPTVQYMCPQFLKTWMFKNEDEVWETKTQHMCNIDGQQMRLYFVEFMGSFIFIFCWVLIRNYKLEKGQLNIGFQNLIKPLLVIFAYAGGNSISAPQIDTSTYAGFKNPMIAFQLWVWDKNYDFTSEFPNPIAPLMKPNTNVYDSASLGAYWWILVVSPLSAGLVVGFIAKWHFSALLEDPVDPSVSQVQVSNADKTAEEGDKELFTE